MFHEGDLQSGISAAIQQQKLVACFIRQDDDETSATWENEWLAGTHETASDTETTANIPTVIKSKTVLLRLDYGTKEASFLSAFCPIDEAPTLVIIHNGTVVDKLEGNLEYSEWAQRLLKACGVDAEGANVDAPAQSQQQTTSTLAASVVPANDATSEGAASAPTDTTSSHSPEQIQALLSERGARLEAERLRREAREKAERLARARAKREEDERLKAEAAAQTDKGKGKQRADGSESARNKARIDWVEQQAKRKTEAKEEKQRIMARIEADKRERKNRDEERKLAASAMAGEPLPSSSTNTAAAATSTSTRTPPTRGSCALQIRLFDGSSIKGRFSHDSTLATAVREWVKETSPAGGADIPFNFRQILTPHPSRTIEISEESQTLADVGLMPTATLVLVPVAGFTEAYSSGTGSGGGIIGSAYGLVSGAFGLAGSALGYVTGYGSGVNSSDGREGIYMGGTADEQEPSNVQGSRMANADSGTGQSGPSRIRVKTMADQRAESEKGAEFYNGNSLGTEGRKDDGDDGK